MLYEQKYKEALETVQEILSSGADAIRIKTLKLRLQSVFPELAESKDERIKKCIIDTLKNYHHLISTGGVTKEDMIAWLEKQGERRSLETDKVIEWMRVKAPKWLYDMVYPISLDVDAEELIEQFKKDFWKEEENDTI